MVKAPTKANVPALKADDANKPAYLQRLEETGRQKPVDNFDDKDVSIPRVKMLQATSPEIEAFDNAKAGLFWHTGLEIPLGDELLFIPCSRNKKYLLVAPLEDGQGILARADDFVTWDRLGKWDVQFKDSKKKLEHWEITDLNVAKSGLDVWGTSRADDPDSPPAATLFYDYLILMPKFLELGPAVLSLTRSAIKPAKRGLNDKIKIHQDAGRPMQAIQFLMKSTTESGSSGDYKGFRFESGGFAPEDLFLHASEYKNSLVGFKIQGEADAVNESAPDAKGGNGSVKGAGDKSKEF